jgi:hypothetical protein
MLKWTLLGKSGLGVSGSSGRQAAMINVMNLWVP